MQRKMFGARVFYTVPEKMLRVIFFFMNKIGNYWTVIHMGQPNKIVQFLFRFWFGNSCWKL